MNFLIFRDFSRIFVIFDEFIWIYFELKKNKKSDFFIACWCGSSHVEVEKGVATWQHKITPHGAEYEGAHVCACVCIGACEWLVR